ncbi:MAG: phage minor capsid protein [Eggerthellaceae bacterium]
MSQIDVAVRRHVVSQAPQAGGRMTLARLAAIGHDLVITSAHYGARPSHASGRAARAASPAPSSSEGAVPRLVQLTGYGGVGGLGQLPPLHRARTTPASPSCPAVVPARVRPFRDGVEEC